MEEEEEEEASAAASIASAAARGVRDVSLLSALAGDASLQSLPPLQLASLRGAVTPLQHAIHSETVAHALTLYRYIRLQQKLIAMRRYTRPKAARKLNRWIAAAYSQQLPELLKRIKHDARYLFRLFSEPAADDEWWPLLLKAIGAAGGRAKHLIQALFMLDCHYAAIQEAYGQAERLRLLRYYLLTKKWSAREIEADLLQDGVIEVAAAAVAAAAPAALPPPPSPQAPAAVPHPEHAVRASPPSSEEENGIEGHEGTRAQLCSCPFERLQTTRSPTHMLVVLLVLALQAVLRLES